MSWSYNHYRNSHPSWGTRECQIGAPPLPGYRPEGQWTAWDYFNAHASDPDPSLFYQLLNRARATTDVGTFSTTRCRLLHRNVYSGVENLSQLLPAEVGEAAAYEAYRIWKHNPEHFQPLGTDITDTLKEGLVAIAAAEASQLWQLTGRANDIYGLRAAMESAVVTASRLFYRKLANQSAGAGAEYAGVAPSNTSQMYSARDYAYQGNAAPMMQRRASSLPPAAPIGGQMELSPSPPSSIAGMGGAVSPVLDPRANRYPGGSPMLDRAGPAPIESPMGRSPVLPPGGQLPPVGGMGAGAAGAPTVLPPTQVPVPGAGYGVGGTGGAMGVPANQGYGMAQPMAGTQAYPTMPAQAVPAVIPPQTAIPNQTTASYPMASGAQVIPPGGQPVVIGQGQGAVGAMGTGVGGMQTAGVAPGYSSSSGRPPQVIRLDNTSGGAIPATATGVAGTTPSMAGTAGSTQPPVVVIQPPATGAGITAGAIAGGGAAYPYPTAQLQAGAGMGMQPPVVIETSRHGHSSKKRRSRSTDYAYRYGDGGRGERYAR
ncbi:hypothetical protein K474DRAFT_1775952 [Panus rudis PR-1116 ss-1]|nr:hypothetical protein K474DRAFT_1775952 [Panus rudis PR-1116 ss-1]